MELQCKVTTNPFKKNHYVPLTRASCQPESLAW